MPQVVGQFPSASLWARGPGSWGLAPGGGRDQAPGGGLVLCGRRERDKGRGGPPESSVAGGEESQGRWGADLLAADLWTRRRTRSALPHPRSQRLAQRE